jgi:uncharacterized membrane protein YfcA
MVQFFLILTVGGFAGVMTGLMGASGVMAVVPGMLLLGYPAQQAISTSLAVDMTASLLVAFTYFQHGKVNLGQGMYIALAAILGAQIGSHFSVAFPEIGLRLGFGLFLIVSSIALWRHDLTMQLEKLQATRLATWFKGRPLLAGVAIGLYAGVYSGIFGAGGGLLFLFALLLLGYSLHQAVGTSTLIMALTTTSGTVGHAMLGQMPLIAIGGVTTGTVLGSLASANLANRMDERFLSKAIALVLGILGVVILLFFIR